MSTDRLILFSMSFLVSLAILLAFWSTIYLIHLVLMEINATVSALYAKFLSKSGLTIQPFQIKWYTVRCNRWFIKLTSGRSSTRFHLFIKHWFNLGVLVGILGQFGSVCFLFYTLLRFLRDFSSSSNEKYAQNEQILVPVVSYWLN